MDYFGILQLGREPFSNSPDPDFFFQSREHLDCLQNLELSLRLRRGLNIVIGEVGSGKTTLCRQLLRNFADDPRFEPHLILDPTFSSEHDFLLAVMRSFDGPESPSESSASAIKENIKQRLFQRGVEEQKIVVLIIDEGQKIPAFCLEILREFLNYETNAYKLLQIVIFAQREFEATLRGYGNFADRINLFHRLGPLDFFDTQAMIQFRIRQASDAPDPPRIFSMPAVWAIYRGAGGYPRKIIHLCHQSLLTMIVQNRSKVDWFIARACVQRRFQPTAGNWRRAGAMIVLSLVAVLLWFAQTGVDTSPRILPKADISSGSLHKSGIAPVKSERIYSPATNAPSSLSSDGPDPIMAQKSDEVTGEYANKEARVASAKEKSDPPKAISAGGTKTAAIDTSVDLTAVKTTQSDSPRPSASQPASDIAATTPATVGDPITAPDLIGTAKAGASEPLSEMIQRVYGDFNKDLMETVLASNPRIKNPNQIYAGQIIRFPCIVARGAPAATGRCWIEIARETTMDDGFRRFRSIASRIDVPVRLIPFRTKEGENRFSIIVKEYFADETNALARLQELKGRLGPQTKVLTGWEPGTVFYSDPYSGRTGR